MSKEHSILRSLEIIEKRISEKLTVESIADGVFISKNHYQRLFRAVVGESVIGYVTKRKLTLAGKALLETGASVLDIALDYGFDSREGFTRSFKAYMGVTPTEYRRYGLTAIRQKTAKERKIMTYSRATDEIIRELNELIAKARDLAVQTSNRDEPFWTSVAKNTDAIADKVESTLEKINRIAEHPDEITSGFALIALVDDYAFQINIMALHIAMAEARDDNRRHEPLADRFRDLGWLSVQKALKSSEYLNNLSSLIIEDMRKTASEKIQYAVERGIAAAEGISGCSTAFKDEILQLVNEFSSTPIEDISVKRLEDYQFKLQVLSFTSNLYVFNWPNAMNALEGVDAFVQALHDAHEYCSSIIKPEPEVPVDEKVRQTMDNIAFQTDILLWYCKAEVESLMLHGEHRALLDTVLAKLEDCMRNAQAALYGTAFKGISDKTADISSVMNAAVDALGTKGGALKVLAVEIGTLSTKMSHCVTEYEALAQQTA